MAKTNSTIKRVQLKNNSSVSRLSRWTIDTLAVAYLFVALIVILAGAKMYLQYIQFSRTVPDDAYQAVFLSNGQVYFGHLGQLNKSFWQLSDVYYVQEQLANGPTTEQDGAEQQVTEEGQDENAATGDSAPADQQSQFSVIRLGNELHQPTNQLVINKEHILFWENIQPDSRILKAIQEEKQNRK